MKKSLRLNQRGLELKTCFNMSKRVFSLFLLSTTLFSTVHAQEYEKPTMGWSSWNTFALNINESIIKGQADAMVNKGFKDAGYLFINIDDGYFGGRDNNTGELKIHPQRFPNGLRGIVDYIHNKGLKAGIYSDGGRTTCGFYHGGDQMGNGVGFYGHDQQDADLFFKRDRLNFDFIKVDFCGGAYGHNPQNIHLDEKQRYEAIWQAIKNTGRTDVRMNICRWDFPGTWAENCACSWRTTMDINCSWGSIKSILKENMYLSAYCRGGHYNDMDMLEVGRSLSEEEDKTHFGMWCIMSSPLLIGCNMATINERARTLLTNKELIALNQDRLAIQAYVVQHKNDTYILVKDLENLFGTTRAIAFYNPTDATKTMSIDFASIDLAGNVKVRDLFAKQDLGTMTNSMSVSVPAHGTRIYKLVAERRLERLVYEAESGYIGNYQEIENNQNVKSGIYSEDGACSGGAKASWLGGRAENYLQWDNVYSSEGGEYTMVLKYMCGENRDVNIQVNDVAATKVTLNSGGWSNVGSHRMTVQLKAGVNKIRIFNNSNWMPDIDCIEISNGSSRDISQIVSGGKGERHLSSFDFCSWNGPSATASSTGFRENNYSGGKLLDGGNLIFGDNEVSQYNYANLTGCQKITFEGSDGVSIRALFNRQTMADNDFIEKDVTISNGKAEINLSEVSTSYVHLNAIKMAWGSPSGTISNVYVSDPSAPMDYYLSGSGSLSESASKALADATAKNIDAQGLSNTKAVALNTANKNCLIYVKDASKLTNTQNVVVKNGNSYTSSNIVLTDMGTKSLDIAQAGFAWASTSGSAQWNSAGGDAYTFSWTAGNDAVEIFHNLTGKTQYNYLVVETSEFTAPWGVRFYDDGGSLIAEKDYWVAQAPNNLIKEINLDSLFAAKGVGYMRNSLKTVSLYGVGDGNNRVTVKDMYFAIGSNNTTYPFFAPYAIQANNASCSVNVDAYSPAWVPFNANIPNGFDAYLTDGNNVTKVSSVSANKPVIVAGNGVAEFKASNVTINATNNLTEGALVGEFEKTKVADGSYVVKKNSSDFMLYQVTSNDNLYTLPLHAFVSSNANNSITKSINALLSGDASGIFNTNVGSPVIEAIYNVAGSKLNHLQKGINIVKESTGETKKILIK